MPGPPAQLPMLADLVAGRCCRWRCWCRSYMFLRGHNVPGGGFIAGLIARGGVADAVHGRRALGGARSGCDYVRGIGAAC